MIGSMGVNDPKFGKHQSSSVSNQFKKMKRDAASTETAV